MKRILWFRRDLRVEDNKILSFGGDVLPIFIFDKNILNLLEKNDKRVTFIFFYVLKLKEDLKKIGLDLAIFYATPDDVFTYLSGFDEVIASGDYDSYAKQRDLKISLKLHFRYVNDTYIFKPKEILKEDKTPYLVFTPFYKKAKEVLKNKDFSKDIIASSSLLDGNFDFISTIENSTLQKLPIAIESLGFEKQDIKIINPYEKLQTFKQKIASYEHLRDYPNIDASSALSVDLRFGIISVREILRELLAVDNSEAFIRQLIFRDFYAYLLFHFPYLESKNYKYNFNGIENEEKFRAFCEAKTGVPIVDAGVRELLETGCMNNRVRMIVASFFTKDLFLPWQWGEAFFASHLLDYDKASNVLSWQWSAGTGVDPQPYFRIFNPYL